ncbi:MAG TPA: hypothetical protein VGK34_00830 [Armatimonadota bacterium]
MAKIHGIRYAIYCSALLALSLLLPGVAGAASAQVELAEPVLPIEDGKAANGNATMVWVTGGDVFDSAANLGGTFPVGRIHRGQIYFHADMFTWIDNPSISSFKPRRIFYTVEPGYNWVKNEDEIRFFIKHQSFHDVDIHIGDTESYELIGLNYRKLTNPHFELRAARYTNNKIVDYTWDFAASMTYDLPKSLGYEAYLHAWVHHVTESGNDFGRDGFTDWAAEYGFTVNDGLKLFARYENLHDIEYFGSRSDHHFMIGPKYYW